MAMCVPAHKLVNAGGYLDESVISFKGKMGSCGSDKEGDKLAAYPSSLHLYNPHHHHMAPPLREDTMKDETDFLAQCHSQYLLSPHSISQKYILQKILPTCSFLCLHIQLVFRGVPHSLCCSVEPGPII